MRHLSRLWLPSNILWIAFFVWFILPVSCSKAVQLDKIKLPPGFKIELYADNLPNARSMTLSPNGTLFVGTRKKGNVYAVLDKNKDNKTGFDKKLAKIIRFSPTSD